MNGSNCYIDYEVATTEPWDAYMQFNTLLGESPYLSEDVIIEFINNPAFSSLMVKLIMIANPHAVRSEAVMAVLENRNPSMPSNYIEEIISQPEITSQLQVLEGNVAADNHLVSMISEEIKHYYRSDNGYEWEKDSLIAFMSRKPGLYDKYELATIYLTYGLYDEMQTVLNGIATTFEMEEGMTNDYNDFSTIVNIAKTMDQNNLYEGTLADTEISALENIVLNDRPLTAPLALSLLMRNNTSYSFNEPVYNLPEYAPRRQKPEVIEQEPIERNEFKLYPNPSINFTTLMYNCTYIDINYIIIDVSGRVQKIGTLESNDKSKSCEVLIDLSQLSLGSYQIIINSGHTALWSEQLIITK